MPKLKYWDGTEWVAIAPSKTEFGDLSSLTTVEKTNLVGAVNEVDGEIIAHKAIDLPHTAVDSVTGTTYKWGLAVEDGVWGYVYEEVV